MTAGYHIVRYRPEFKPEIAELQRYLLTPDAGVNTAYFEWKYERTPYQSEPLVHLALCDGRVVGMRGLYGSKWQAGDPPETALVPCADGLVIHPAHRNRGLVSSILKAASASLAETGQEWLFSLSASPVTLVSSLAMGWRRVGAMQPMATGSPGWPPADRLRALASRSNLLRQAARRAYRVSTAVTGHPFERLKRNAARHPLAASCPVTVSAQARPEAMAGLIERLEWDGRIRHLRDRDYFAWRFQNPLFRYCFLSGDDRLEGYLVLRAPVFWLAPVAIVDWEGSSVQVLGELLRSAVAWGRFGKLTAWATAPLDNRTALLRENGFRDEERVGAARYHPCILVHRVHEGPRAAEWSMGGRPLLDPASWDMRMLYSMYG